jgi:hypothetical protein
MANLMRTSNPALNEKAFKGQVAFGEVMTLQGPSTRQASFCFASWLPPHEPGACRTLPNRELPFPG